MEEKVKRAHEVAVKATEGVPAEQWGTVYNNVFHAMLAGTFANPLPDDAGKTDGD